MPLETDHGLSIEQLADDTKLYRVIKCSAHISKIIVLLNQNHTCTYWCCLCTFTHVELWWSIDNSMQWFSVFVFKCACYTPRSNSFTVFLFRWACVWCICNYMHVIKMAKWINVKSGIPQGSTLGPLLFLL